MKFEITTLPSVFFFLAIILLSILLATCPSDGANASTKGTAIFDILMRYGMTLLHHGRDHFALKKPLKLNRVEIQDVRVYNLASMRPACQLQITPQAPVRSRMMESWDATYECFQVVWCIGFDEIRAEGRSKVRSFFRTKVIPCSYY